MNLTDIERDILSRVARGATHAEVGAELGLSRKSVTDRLVELYDEHDVHNVVGLLWQAGWITLPWEQEPTPITAAPPVMMVRRTA